jgi:DnaJ-class molecular chaperone
LYDTIGVSRDAKLEDIEVAYKKLVKVHKGDEKMVICILYYFNCCVPQLTDINYAYSVLSNPTKRSVYNTYGKKGLRFAESVGDKHVESLLAAKEGNSTCLIVRFYSYTNMRYKYFNSVMRFMLWRTNGLLLLLLLLYVL